MDLATFKSTDCFHSSTDSLKKNNYELRYSQIPSQSAICGMIFIQHNFLLLKSVISIVKKFEESVYYNLTYFVVGEIN